MGYVLQKTPALHKLYTQEKRLQESIMIDFCYSPVPRFVPNNALS